MDEIRPSRSLGEGQLPHKQSLLFAVLERHLGSVFSAVERACKGNHYQPLDAMVEGVVRVFVDAKIARRDTSLALYAVAPDLNGQTLIAELTTTAQSSMCSMLKTASGIRFSQIEFAVLMFFSAMVGATRALLEGGASRQIEENVRRHLVLLGRAYLKTAAMQSIEVAIQSIHGLPILRP